MKRVEGKIALITGAARGIGLKTAERLAAEGATVILCDLLQEEGQAAAGQIGPSASFISLDVTSPDAWTAAIAQVKSRYSKLDILVNNAGISPYGSIENTEYDLWKKVMAVNADSAFLGCKNAFPLMKESGGGSIINLSSIMGIRSDANLLAYSASKGAVRLLTKSVALSGGPFKIRCNSVHPGAVQTKMIEDFVKDFPDPATVMKLMGEKVPLGRTGQTDDIANAILYLASDESSWVTGLEMAVDGGSLL